MEIVRTEIVAVVGKILRRSFDWFPCHRRHDRSFIIFGKKLPICARCTSILIGYVFSPFFIGFHITIPYIWITFMMIPILLDGFTQLWKWRESNNLLRFLTGFSFGLAQSFLISNVVHLIVDFMV
ncbi:DUF2085 domain-containing protein [Bacillus massilioanorexius]|uniref:DUF2085 domain-containing protein n=1 Tax=Bacillus massilioanorexius TaxID=1468413 RepID=UPI0011DE21DD|nr:DUF2085 domain-containing protein [Bacillus massilioanorexius]